MDPVQLARHPGAGLVEVGHRRGGQLPADRLDEPAQPRCALDHHRGQGAGRHAGGEHVGQQLRSPVDRQVLVHAQVAHQRAHPRPVAGRGPRLVGKPAGGGVPAVHWRRWARWPTTLRCSGGRSNICRASTPTTTPPARSAPHPPRRSGRCSTTSSGSATCARCAPGAPGCLPDRRRCARSSARRPVREGLPSPSVDGGLEELVESLPSRRSSSATRAWSAAMAWACAALAARNWAITAAWTATVASRSAPQNGSGPPGHRAVTPACPWAMRHRYRTTP
jgi:hypothetical protein